MIDKGDCGAIGGMKIGRGNQSTLRKPLLQTYVTTGFTQGCKVREQQSKSLIESFPTRCEFVPYPDAWASFFFS
jgi:hypothetical protein